MATAVPFTQNHLMFSDVDGTRYRAVRTLLGETLQGENVLSET